MKKSLFRFLPVLCVAFVIVFSLFVFTACGGNKENEGEKSSFSVSVKADGDCSVSVVDSAKEGELVSIVVTVTNTDKYIGTVTADGKECAENDGKYTFTMPAKDVEIVVKLNEYEEVLADDGLASIEDPMDIVPMNGCNTVFSSVDKKWSIPIGFNPSYTTAMTILKENVRSTNEKVIPSDAITIEPETGSGSNLIIGGEIIIDTTRITEGTTWLLLTLANGNTSPDHESNLSLKLTVVPYGDLELYTMEETLVFDVSSMGETGTYTVRMSDKDYVSGTSVNGEPSANYYDYTVEAKDGKITIKFDYILDHYYYLSISEGESYEFESARTFSIEQKIIHGDTITGFDGYDSDGLHFVTPKLTLELDVTKAA